MLATEMRAAGLGFGAAVSCAACLAISSVAVADLHGRAAALAKFQNALPIATGAVVKRVIERLERAWDDERMPEEIAALASAEETRLTLRVPEAVVVAARAFPDVCRLTADAFVLESPGVEASGTEELLLERTPEPLRGVSGVAGIAGALSLELPFRTYRRGTLLTRRGLAPTAIRVEPTSGRPRGIVLAPIDLLEPV